MALMKSDLLIVIGSRLDVRQTGSRTDAFSEGRTIFHVDCEAGEINNRVTNCHAIVADVRQFLDQFEAVVSTSPALNRDAWLGEIECLRKQWPDTAELSDAPGINPNEFMHQLSRASQEAGVYVADVGQHQMWAAQSLELSAGQRFLTSGGMGSMGFGLPASIGASLNSGGRPVVLIAGDGGFQCNIQELQTAMRLSLPLKIVVMNNQCHGMVRQFQQSYFDSRYQSTYWGYSAPDFSRVGSAYGVESRRLEDRGDLDSTIEWLWREPSRPQLLEVMIDTFINSYPKVAFGRAINEMEPFSTPIEMEST